MLLTSFLFFLFSSFDLDAKDISSPKFTKLDIFKEPDVLQSGERFFKINKSTYPSSASFNVKNIGHWEKVFGPLRKKTPPLKRVSIDKLKENAIVEGATIYFFDLGSEKVRNYTFGKFVNVCLLESPYDNPYPSPYLGYAILLSDSEKSCDDLVYGSFESIGYIGNRFKISTSVDTRDATSRVTKLVPADVTDIKELLRKTLGLSSEEVNKLRGSVEEVKGKLLYYFSLSKKVDSEFFKYDEKSYVYWDWPQREKESLRWFNTWISDSLLSGIYEGLLQSYLLIFYEDKVLKFPLEERDMSMFQ